MIKNPALKLYSLVVISILSCFAVVYSDVSLLTEPKPSQPIPINTQHAPVSYTKDVKPILDSRCVACHACYDSPCQLKLTAFEGLSRGATKKTVYDHERLEAVEPTRLFVDETSTEGWRTKDFFAVVNEQNNSPQDNLNKSLIAKLLRLKHDNPLPTTGKLPEDIELTLERELQCPTLDEFAKHQQKHPLWGMPYGISPLTESQETTLLNWLQDGAKSDQTHALSPLAIAEISKWEDFFNGTSLKEQLSSRYFYEHLYLGDLHFKGHPPTEFYKLVRSKTPSGQDLVEINSVRPFDDPNVSTFYYRLRPITSTIVDKDHFVYELSDEKMARLRSLFLTPDYTVTALPSYDQVSAANPFKTFSELPEVARYSFLLDNSQFFFSGFIKGPVCMGQAALNVIRDQFWVAFVKPQTEYNKQYTQFLADNSEHLRMPASEGEGIGFKQWRKFQQLQYHYLENKDAFVNNVLWQQQAANLNLIWDGDGHNENALLTVFRHYDNATVVTGLLGKTPLTTWVVDYPIFERIHYLLVAGYNVYGSAGHQVTTRLYMDFLRMESENLFLKFIPLNAQKSLHDSWYQGIDLALFGYFETPSFGTDKEPAIAYSSTDYKSEFFAKVQQKLGEAAGKADLINRCQQNCTNANSTAEQQQIDAFMRQLANLTGNDLTALPEVSFLRVKTANPDQDPVYTLIRNKKLRNVSFIFAEDLRREPEKDTLTVIPDFIGSYPNIFFGVPVAQLADFIDQLKHSQTDTDKDNFYSHYGIRRNNPEIWQYYDYFNQKHLTQQPETGGLFDMNRYENL
ncbi:MAG: fatty acid cis/trans isomerase [Methylococcaceae bacterium NSP1-2]|nr:fatty acid cis/trans isomerase [Methylococcaceae bacterium]OYV19180.1 MAG: fatty acid cis/trans isomerase [Methylococcaceae bacterium NSP1-2]